MLKKKSLIMEMIAGAKRKKIISLLLSKNNYKYYFHMKLRIK